MFNKNNFCHIASNNRNEKKAGVFVYKTTDNIAAVSASGYFNDKIIDINLHDLIIHEWHDPADRTKVERNVLCVVERTLDNVGTTLIKSKIEGDIEQEIADLQTYVDNTFVRKDGTSIMTGPLKFRAGSFEGAIAGGLGDGIAIYKLKSNGSIDSEIASLTKTNGFVPANTNELEIGSSSLKWKNLYIAGKVYAPIINNGVDLTVPTPAQADKLALKSEVDTAANSGSQLTNKGVWYAKMYAATVVPTGSEYDGRNYADFSQTDINGDPIIVLYEGQSGVWVQTQTITPPTDYNGYVTITSKIWDIAEQSGQQGGLVLWAFNTKTFTPYPKIISFEDAALTGTPTAPNLSVSSPNNQIVNKQALDDALLNHGTGRNVSDIFWTMRKDSALNGAVECNGGTYNTTDFTGAESIGELLEDGKVPYVSLATYATLLSTQGSCGVFGWDGVGTTAFRVPSLNDIFVETGTAAQIGDYLPAGLPNIKSVFDGVFYVNSYNGTNVPMTSDNGVFYNAGNSVGTMHVRTAEGANQTAKKLGLDASRATGSVYSDSVTTVQPNTVRYRAMVQLMTSATDEAVATCTAVMAQVAANTSAINGADYVVESQLPTAENNYIWYRKYKSGWVEQGGEVTFPQHGSNTSKDMTVQLPVTMADSHYHVNAPTFITDAGQSYGLRNYRNVRSTTTLQIGMYTTSSLNGSYLVQWSICGQQGS